jgi:hypothetical protein
MAPADLAKLAEGSRDTTARLDIRILRTSRDSSRHGITADQQALQLEYIERNNPVI